MGKLEIGTVCIKTKGREAGKKAVIVSWEKDFAVVDGPQVKRAKCNPRHLFPTSQKISITENASHEEIIKMLKV